MDNAFGVGRLKRFRGLNRNLPKVVSRQWPAVDCLLQALAFEELHHDDRLPLMFLYAVNRADIRVA